MRKSIKITIIVAAGLVAVGIILAGIGAATGELRPIYWNGGGFQVEPTQSRLTSKDFDSKEKATGRFDSIEIDSLDLYDVEFVQGNEYKVEYTYCLRFGEPIVELDGTTLKIKEKERIRVVDFNLFDAGELFGSSGTQPRMTVYYPEHAEFEKVVINVDAGTVKAGNFTAKSLSMNLDLGNASLDQIVADHLEVYLDCGNLNMEDVDAESADLSLDLGTVKSSNFLTRGLEVSSSSGDVKLKGTFLGTSSISCDLGSVEVNTTAAKSTYNYSVNVDLGTGKVDGQKVSGTIDNNSEAKNRITVEASMGDVNLNFGS